MRRSDEFVDSINWNAHHGGKSHQPTHEVGPSGEFIVDVLGRRPHYHVEYEHTKADDGGSEHPAEFPPEEGIVAYHFFDVVVPLVGSVTPADGNTFEHNEEDETHSRGGVRIQHREHIHSALCDTG